MYPTSTVQTWMGVSRGGLLGDLIEIDIKD